MLILSKHFYFKFIVVDSNHSNFDNFQGHVETIFDCKFKPESPDLLATASFDGTIKVWDVNTMSAVSIYSV